MHAHSVRMPVVATLNCSVVDRWFDRLCLGKVSGQSPSVLQGWHWERSWGGSAMGLPVVLAHDTTQDAKGDGD